MSHTAVTHLRMPYALSEYRVRLARGGYACICCGESLPAILQPWLPTPTTPWAFVTAWNPRSRMLTPQINRHHQRQLLTWLRATHPHAIVHPGIGVGTATADVPAWREPSLFVVDIAPKALDRLMHRFRQNAVIHGRGNAPARLRWNATLPPDIEPSAPSRP